MGNLLRIAGCLLFGGALWVAYTQAPQPSKLDTVKLKDDLYVIHNDYVPGNSTALITNEGVILVDDKFPQDYAGIMAELKKITNQPVKYIVNTHHHGDHSGSNPNFQMAGAQIVSSEAARRNMVDGKQPGLPNITIDDHASLYLGGKHVELYYFGRAHTNGDIVAYFPDHKVLASGDMFTIGDATPELIDYSGGGSAKEWPRTVEKALKLDFTTVVPGHGPVGNKGDMEKFRVDADKLKNRIHDMVAQKKSRAEIAKAMTDEFHWADLHIQRGLDGAMIELQ